VDDPGGSGIARPVTFADHFGARTASYRLYRPDYPPELFAYLAGLSPRRELAWDCGTGSGQAAVGLAAHFARVAATDASEAQLAHAEPNERVEYRTAPAEASGLAGTSVDLVAVAQALHWFDRPAFYREVRRVLRPGATLAVTTPAHGRATALAILLRGFEPTFDPRSPHLRFFSRRSLTALLDAMGFDVASARRERGTLLVTATR